MKTNPSLWARLEALDLEQGTLAFGFAARLARDNNWSYDDALASITEYKRFVYLAMVAGHEVTPSDEVDQVWHLHMTYTRHYWGEFAECLGAPLHHGPTTGSHEDKSRFDDNYLRTLQTYEKEFGVAPPAALWPDASIRFGEAPYYRRINTKRNLVVAVPNWFSNILSAPYLRPLAAFSTAGLAGVTVAHAALSTPQNGGLVGFVQDNLIGVLIVAAVLIVIGLAVVSPGVRRRRSGKAGEGGAVLGAGCSAGAKGGKSGGKDGSHSDGMDGGSSGCGGCGGCGG